MNGGFGGGAGAGQGFGGGFGGAEGFGGFDDIFSSFFGGGGLVNNLMALVKV